MISSAKYFRCATSQYCTSKIPKTAGLAERRECACSSSSRSQRVTGSKTAVQSSILVVSSLLVCLLGQTEQHYSYSLRGWAEGGVLIPCGRGILLTTLPIKHRTPLACRESWKIGDGYHTSNGCKIWRRAVAERVAGWTFPTEKLQVRYGVVLSIVLSVKPVNR